MDGITMIIPREKVLRMQRLSDEQRRRTLQKRYEAARRRYPTKAALHHYLRGRIAYQLQLAEPAIEELERAYATVLDLPALVANYRADNLFQTALWHDTIGATALARRACERILEEYPQTASSEAARGLLKKIQERKEQRNYRRTYKIEATAKPEPAAPPPVAEPEPVDVAAAEPEEPEEVAAVEAAVEPEPEPEPEEESTTEAVAEEPLPTGDNENRNLGATRQQTAEITSTVDLGPANKIFDAAVALYRKGISVQGAQRNELLGQAEKKFNQAIALYDQALKQDPGNADIQSRLTDANMLRYGCLKYKTLR
jgi:tetratricopeptide (TPR) repeat protein